MNAFSSLLASLPAAHGGYLGQTIALAVAVSWTVCALLSETVSRRLGAHVVNVLRMVLSLLFIGALLWVCTGSPLPPRADATTWGWLLASGAVGYVFGDYCLFNAYLLIGSRFGQLFMTLAPAVSALAGWLLLGERLSPQALAGMAAATAPAAAEHLRWLLPFAATQMRAVAGLPGFLLILFLAGKGGALRRACTDGRGWLLMAATVVFGPFVGVSLSLMATQYTSTGVAMTIMSLSPVLILWPAHVLFGQRVTRREVLGALISVAGVALFFV